MALGIGRLSAFHEPHTGLSSVSVLWERFNQETQRNIIKMVLMAVATLLGFWGFSETADEGVRWQKDTLWNNAFRTMQLLTTQFPGNLAAELPWQLQIARFAMPIFAIWFTLTAVLRRFNRPVLAWLTGLRHGHIVLFGDTLLNVALARAYRRMGRRVVAITPKLAPDAVSSIERGGVRLVFGDAADAGTLKRAAVHRAALAIAADDVGDRAVAMATSIAATNRALRGAGREPLIFLMRLGNRELRALVATQVSVAMKESRVDLRLYVRERTLARSLLARYPADWGLAPGAYDIHAVVIGLGDMGAELLLQLARVAVPPPGRRCILTVVDNHADGLRDQLLAEYPGLEHCAELRFITAEIKPSAFRARDAEAWLLSPLPATAIYVCCGDDHANLSMAIGIRRIHARMGVRSPALFVHQRGAQSSIDALPHLHATALDTFRIMPFGGLEQEADPYYLIDEEIDALARRLHQNYLDSADRASSGPAAVPWSELPEPYRIANRSQADHVLIKLRALGWHATANPGAAPRVDDSRLEALAEQEHVRWCRDRWMAGWNHGSVRDNQQLRHPDLIPYAQLSERLKALDRQTITALPEFLGKLGIGLRRDRRVGIWIPDGIAGADDTRMLSAFAGSLEAAEPETFPSHLQLVLPLRSPVEAALALRMARRGHCGVDIAFLHAEGCPDIGGNIDRQMARRLVSVADRAFVSPVDHSAGKNVEDEALAAFCAVCDRVLVAVAGPEDGEALRGRFDPVPAAKIELVIVVR